MGNVINGKLCTDKDAKRNNAYNRGQIDIHGVNAIEKHMDVFKSVYRLTEVKATLVISWSGGFFSLYNLTTRSCKKSSDVRFSQTLVTCESNKRY